MNHPITDAGVARLAVHEGRAELLEEIMAVAPVERPTPTDDRRHRRLLPVLAAAAAVLAVIGGATWLGGQHDDRDRASTGPAPASSGPADPVDRAVLTDPGWEVRNVQDDPKRGGEVSYEKGHRQVDVYWRPADSYDAYVVDRNDLGTPVEVDLLGKTSLMWAYSKRDHTVIRPVEGDFTIEVRGTGMGETAFRSLLDRLVLVDEQGFQSSLPADAVLDHERPAAVAEILADIPQPAGFHASSFESHALARYHLIADVTGAVTCAWIEQFRAGRAAGDAAAVSQAQQALGTARDWAALQEIAADGGWSDVVWDYADIVVAGAPRPQDDDMLDNALHGGLGCDD